MNTLCACGCGLTAAKGRKYASARCAPFGFMTHTNNQREHKAALPDGWITAKDAAIELGIWDDRVYKLAREGKIPGKKSDTGAWMFNIEAIRAAKSTVTRRMKRGPRL